MYLFVMNVTQKVDLVLVHYAEEKLKTKKLE